MKDEIEVTPSGGKQTKLYSSITEIPPSALLEVGKVMLEGRDKYGHHNWHKISIMSEINHAVIHALEFIKTVDSGEFDENKCGADAMREISHFAARALMALDQYIRQPTYLHEVEKSNEQDS